MSFYRVGQNKRKKPSIPKRPGWDDSVNDLTVYRATPEEVFLRKEAHKSKNHMSVKLEKLRKERQKSKLTGAEAKQLAIMKEVLYDQHELQKVLAKSDTMMAVVKDLFGDDPKRFMGFPNVTSAPQADSESYKSGSLVASVPDIYTRTEKLSDSVMNQFALNDVQSDSDSELESDGEGSQPQPISYQSQLNLQRFRDFVQEEEKLSAHIDPPSLVSQLNKVEEEKRNKNAMKDQEVAGEVTGAAAASTSSTDMPDNEKVQMMQLLSSLLNQGKADTGNTNDTQMLNALLTAAAAKKREEAGFKTPPKASHSPPLLCERTPPSAMNDTKKLKKTKRCTKTAESQADSINTSVSMNNMRQVLQELENDVAAYELQTGRRPQQEPNKSETFSGYTIALVSAVSKLTKYLKETDMRVRAEVTLREQLTQDVYQLRTIIDALATDIILTQEEYGKLYSEHQRYKDNTTAALASINNQMRELRLMVAANNSEIDTGQKQEVSIQQLQEEEQKQQQQPLNASSSTTKCDTSITSTPVYNQQDSSTQSGSSSYKPLPSQMLPTNSIAAATSIVAASAAVMLSPPVRKTRVHSNNADFQDSNHSKVTQRQTSLVDISNLPRQDQGWCMDPPHLTQTPPIMTTVNVPRPIPLVQTNVNVTLPGDKVSFKPPSTTFSQQSSYGTSQRVNGFT
ncbi:spindle and centriole-associated protein 1, partial [Elysia marginata]